MSEEARYHVPQDLHPPYLINGYVDPEGNYHPVPVAKSIVVVKTRAVGPTYIVEPKPKPIALQVTIAPAAVKVPHIARPTCGADRVARMERTLEQQKKRP